MLRKIINDNKVLHLILNTWSNDSIGIYDYSSSSIKKLRAFIPDSTYVVRTKGNIFQNIEQHADINFKNGDDLLFYVNNNNNDTFILVNPIPKKLKLTQKNYDYLNNKMWYVLKTVSLDNSEENMNGKESNEDYYLNENDLIKIGRVKYAVQKLFIRSKDIGNVAEPPAPLEEKYNISESNKGTPPVFEFNYEVQDSSGYVDLSEKDKTNKNDKKEIKCENCVMELFNNETDDGENFFISFCKCKEKKYYHYKCLKDYLKKLMEIKENPKEEPPVETMTFKNFECSGGCSIQITKC